MFTTTCFILALVFLFVYHETVLSYGEKALPYIRWFYRAVEFLVGLRDDFGKFPDHTKDTLDWSELRKLWKHDEVMLVTAIHEAGHAVCVLPPARIRQISIYQRRFFEHGGQVLTRYPVYLPRKIADRVCKLEALSENNPNVHEAEQALWAAQKLLLQHDPNRNERAWSFCVHTLGGLASEAVYRKKFDSTGANRDLRMAARYARFLVEQQNPAPPWNEQEEENPFDLSRVFRTIQANSPEACILNRAYSRAKVLVKQRRSRVNRIVLALNENWTLDEDAVARL